MKHASLFSGIGGFDLAATWMGWENVFHCEWNEFCQKVLKYHWPNAISYGDITKTDFTIHRGRIDILTGGFPCQPYSLAGKRLGKEDDRHLWPEMLRAIREIAPPWIVGENVSGLINWSGGLVFDEVQSDLEAEGYEVLPVVLPAVAVDAPHRRDRIWFIACSGSNKLQTRQQNREQENTKKNETRLDDRAKRFSYNGAASDTDKLNGHISGFCSGEIPQYKETDIRECIVAYPISNGLQRNGSQNSHFEGTRTYKEIGSKDRLKIDSGYPDHTIHRWQNLPTQSPICGGNDGIPRKLDGITFPKWRNESIKAFGNAVVPQVPYQIFKAIDQYLKTT